LRENDLKGPRAARRLFNSGRGRALYSISDQDASQKDGKEPGQENPSRHATGVIKTVLPGIHKKKNPRKPLKEKEGLGKNASIKNIKSACSRIVTGG